MIKVKVKNKISQKETHGAQFKTKAEADAWVISCEEKKAWGKRDRWVTKELEDISQATATREVLVSPAIAEIVDEKTSEIIKEASAAVFNTEYFLPAEYEISFEDISTEALVVKLISKRSKKRKFGEFMVDKISIMNEAKGITTAAQTDAFMNNPKIANLREHLRVGNIDTFVELLQKADLSANFTAQEKASVLAECQEFIAAIAGEM